MTNIALSAALAVLLFPNGVLSRIGASHYGDCGGNGKMPPPEVRSGQWAQHPNDGTSWRYVFAEGMIACANGEKIAGRVQLWNDNRVEGHKPDEKASGGSCGPE